MRSIRRQRDDHAPVDGVRPAGQAGTRATSDHGDAVACTGSDDGAHLLGRLRLDGGARDADRRPLGLVAAQGRQLVGVGDDAVLPQRRPQFGDHGGSCGGNRLTRCAHRSSRRSSSAALNGSTRSRSTACPASSTTPARRDCHARVVRPDRSSSMACARLTRGAQPHRCARSVSSCPVQAGSSVHSGATPNASVTVPR